jgi:hypothetical protein
MKAIFCPALAVTVTNEITSNMHIVGIVLKADSAGPRYGQRDEEKMKKMV